VDILKETYVVLRVATLLLLPAFLQLLQREGLMRKVRFTNLALGEALVALLGRRTELDRTPAGEIVWFAAGCTIVTIGVPD